jgi:hypothetical protein
MRKRSAIRCINSNWAIGLRHVLPVQTSNTTRLAPRSTAVSVNTPGRKISSWLPTARTTVEAWPYLLRPSLNTIPTRSPND